VTTNKTVKREKKEQSGLFGLWDKECARCGRNDTYPNVQLERHHVVKRSTGGTDEDTVWLCSECHRWVEHHPAEAEKIGLHSRVYKINKKRYD
jgi:hypothetical protein